MRTGVLGGTFNPVHFGHLRAAEEIRERLALEKIIFIPSCTPPLKSEELAKAEDRLAMTRLAVSGNRFFEVSDIECRRQEKSYSVRTVEELKSANPKDDFFFILGIDAFMDLPNWKEPERLVSLADFVIINRPPFTFPEIVKSPYIDNDAFREPEERGVYEAKLLGGRCAILVDITPLHISSTDIRESAHKGLSLKYLLPEAVESFIMSHGLYSN